ncbi:MAG: hypothetical protein NTU73_04445 [Ignavibacteriae bacterium]|nr:hypothetical protein [Ignavibacteriota bacterium]
MKNFIFFNFIFLILFNIYVSNLANAQNDNVDLYLEDWEWLYKNCAQYDKESHYVKNDLEYKVDYWFFQKELGNDGKYYVKKVYSNIDFELDSLKYLLVIQMLDRAYNIEKYSDRKIDKSSEPPYNDKNEVILWLHPNKWPEFKLTRFDKNNLENAKNKWTYVFLLTAKWIE